MGFDRFGNPHAPNVSYARGEILRSTEETSKGKVRDFARRTRLTVRPAQASPHREKFRAAALS
jgi:hypothetical protein